MRRISVNILGSILGLLFAVSYVSGAAVMSVDLGSEWMKVGVVSPGVPMEMALNKESKRKTPTVIAFRDGERVFGEDAQTIGVRFPANSYAYLVDLLGKTLDNPIVQLYRKRFPYYDIIEDPERKTIVFKNGDENFSIEELVAQLLAKAREFAQDSTGQTITECVIVVPGFFGQSERTALLSAAKLANLKVLQLINDYTAVGLNYGIFRRKEINETAQYFVFYDMGAYKTSAAVVSYQLVKDKATRETLPVIQVLGVGYDRTLGGLEMQIRLRDHLGKAFNEMKKTKTDVFSNPRAVAKLFKEAGRVKNVLSANSEHYAQIEGLLEEHDFRLMVTRDQFEKLCADLFDRVAAPLERALATSGLTLEVINQVVLFGGNTRVPKIQEILKKIIKQDLAKNLNADEAACMGAVYRAADLATGFKVKKFITKDAVLFPVQVTFDREDETGNIRHVKRTLFGSMNSYPQKKVITFNKHVNDFSFDVNYAELESHFSKEEIVHLGSTKLTAVSLSDVASTLEANKADHVESKGIKAHFILDDSGLFSLANAEMIFEKTVNGDESESAFQKLGSTISKLFSSSDSKTSDEEVEKKDDSEEATPKPGNETQTNGTVAEDAATANKTEKPKIVTIKEVIPSEIKIIYIPSLEGAKYSESAAKIAGLDDIDNKRKRRETALNGLESFVIDAQVKMDEEEYASCATAAEIEAIKASCSEISEWLYEEGTDADAITYEKKLDHLHRITNEPYSRHWEHNERPEALRALYGMINGSEGFLQSAKNLTKESNSEKDVFTQNEVDNLEKAILETIQWRDREVMEQKKLARNEPVRLTVKSLTDKMALLDREVKYLVNKIKVWKPKVKPTTPPPKPAKEAEKDEESAKETETVGEEPLGAEAVNEEIFEQILEPSETLKTEADPEEEVEAAEEQHSEL